MFAASALLPLWLARRWREKSARRRSYTGMCHCGAVKFACQAPEHLVVWQCNCTFCNMLKNWHFIIPESDFTLDEVSRQFVKEYTFNTKVAKHLFCSICGISPFYRPRSNPDGYAVTLACVDEGQIGSHEYRYFNGRQWEQFHAGSGISAFSK